MEDADDAAEDVRGKRDTAGYDGKSLPVNMNDIIVFNFDYAKEHLGQLCIDCMPLQCSYDHVQMQQMLFLSLTENNDVIH